MFSAVDCGRISSYPLCCTMLLGEYICSVDKFLLDIHQYAERLTEKCVALLKAKRNPMYELTEECVHNFYELVVKLIQGLGF